MQPAACRCRLRGLLSLPCVRSIVHDGDYHPYSQLAVRLPLPAPMRCDCHTRDPVKSGLRALKDTTVYGSDTNERTRDKDAPGTAAGWVYLILHCGVATLRCDAVIAFGSHVRAAGWHPIPCPRQRWEGDCSAARYIPSLRAARHSCARATSLWGG
jgi:hypothetical protein